MNEPVISINWSDWFSPREESEYFDASGVLYMIGTDEKSMYISYARKGTTVRERLQHHLTESGGPLTWLEKNRNDFQCPLAIKVGIPDLGKNTNKMLRSITNLLVKREKERGGCMANREGPAGAGSYFKSGLTVPNTGEYSPLQREYI